VKASCHRHGRGTSRKGHYDALVRPLAPKPLQNQNIKPIISVGEARKLLDLSATQLTDGELTELLLQQEQIIRFIFRKYSVHKSAVVE